MGATSVVICPKVIPAMEADVYEASFLFHYLKRHKLKAMIPNECWSALKHRIFKKYAERFAQEIAPEKARDHIARLRSWLSPENHLLDRFGKDISPAMDADHATLVQKTSDLIRRKGAIVKHFISEDASSYKNDAHKPITLNEFFNKCLKSQAGSQDRVLAEEFVKEYPHRKED